MTLAARPQMLQLIRMNSLIWSEWARQQAASWWTHAWSHSHGNIRAAKYAPSLMCRSTVDWPDWAPFFCNGVNDQPHRHRLFKANISTKIQSISARSIIKETKISPVVLGYFERGYSHLLCPSTCEIRVTHMHTHAGRDAVSDRRQARVSLVKPCYASGGQIPTEKSINIQIKFSCVFSLYLKRLKSQKAKLKRLTHDAICFRSR